MSDFDPTPHLIQLKGKLYLETKFRIQWFRADHPGGALHTEVISMEPVLVKATVIDATGTVLATGHGGAQDKGNAVWSGRAIEKAETAAIGRALAHAGYGTQFASDRETDTGNVVDSPVERTATPKTAQQQLGNGGNRRAVLPTDAANERRLRALFERCAVWFEADGEAGGFIHFKNTVAWLETNGVIPANADANTIIEKVIEHRKEKQTA